MPKGKKRKTSPGDVTTIATTTDCTSTKGQRSTEKIEQMKIWYKIQKPRDRISGFLFSEVL
jgi:hypothetical protein